MNRYEPLMNRYLWAVGSASAQIPTKNLVQGRYQVVAPQVWLDTRPEQPTYIPERLPNSIIPYLRLYPQHLHIPDVYGYVVLNDEEGASATEILLLDNAPIDAAGNPHPSILEAWVEASPVRQVYWLWQILQLWTPLTDLGVASSLLVAENLRVEGWRVRLRQLYGNAIADGSVTSEMNGGGSNRQEIESQGVAAQVLVKSPENPTLQQLGQCWAAWFSEAQRPVTLQLQQLYEQMQAEKVSLGAIAQRLNQILLEQAAQQPWRCRVAGATDTGPNHQHNEDTCYPTIAHLTPDFSKPTDPLTYHLSIVCDGIGGHEGGEVASQLAVQSLRLQVQALLAEIAEDPELMTPELVTEQLTAIIRVANNLIASRNDEQGRESRRRMGTTLVMALQLPQQVNTPNGLANSHELYLAHVGDSRAYWITPQYCHQLTVDDDVAAREVRMGRSLYQQALERPDAGALTQALGTREAEFIRPTVQRFILEEDGLLLLCSDGLSDNNWIEQSWADYAEPILSGQMSVEAAVQSLIELANQKNGHDNTSVVLTYCRVSPEYPVILNLEDLGTSSQIPEVLVSSEVPETAETVADEEPIIQKRLVKKKKQPVTAQPSWLKGISVALGILILIIVGGGVGLTAWWLLNPESFQLLRDRLQNSEPSTVKPLTSPSPNTNPPEDPQ